jgi:hypothetical protein
VSGGLILILIIGAVVFGAYMFLAGYEIGHRWAKDEMLMQGWAPIQREDWPSMREVNTSIEDQP